MPRTKRFMTEAQMKAQAHDRRQQKASYNRRYSHDHAGARRAQRWANRFALYMWQLAFVVVLGLVIYFVALR